MDRILERYESYCYAEKALVRSEPEPDQGNWHYEYSKLKAKIEVLHRSHRHLMGEQLESLTVKELQQLEHQIEGSLKHIRLRKTQVMFDSIAELQRKEKMLQEQNKILEKEQLMEKQKARSSLPQQAHWEQQQNQLQTSSSSPPSFLIAEHPALSIGYLLRIQFSINYSFFFMTSHLILT
ncbi:FRUITFULL-like MADS-box [Canna indica]|uniref:FRUITFULL-like MADS-box n=1 Tax=Canna indica TaxID=4628 RepID=A0AAQ3Q9D6_9LILI|nr:FRUITFULL-like MADS-box [Canna indica]